MGFFSKLFGKRDSAPAAPIKAPEATDGIGYDPKLIHTLLAHHAQLGRTWASIRERAEAGDHAAIPPLLQRFRTSLQGHILTENVRFYVYLEKSLADDAGSTETMREFRQSMNGIARQVVAFNNKWEKGDLATAGVRKAFLDDYASVSSLLEQRFDSEEQNLYPLYQPS